MVVLRLQVEVDVVVARADGQGLRPVDLMRIVAVFVLDHRSQAKVAHNAAGMNTGTIHDFRALVFGANQSVIGNQEDRPAFVQEVQELTDVVVGLLVELFHIELRGFG